MAEKWMGNVKSDNSLRRSLNVPQGKDTPKSFLRKIKNTELGSKASNPTSVGKSSIKVTNKLKKKAVAALNMMNA